MYNKCIMAAADVKMEIPVLVRSLKSSTLSSTSFQMDKTVWGVVSAAVEQSRRKANMVAQGDGKFGPWGWPQDLSKPNGYGRLLRLTNTFWLHWHLYVLYCIIFQEVAYMYNYLAKGKRPCRIALHSPNLQSLSPVLSSS